MEKKKFYNKIISAICILTLCVSGIVVPPRVNAAEKPTLDESFTKVDFATYGIESGTYSGNRKTVTGKKGPNGLDKVVFSDTVKFTGETFPRFIIGGKDDYMGVVFGVYQPNELYMYGSGFSTKMIKFTSEEAGTEIIGKSVKLTASFEYVDNNGIGGENDLKIAVWFNDILYGDTYYYFNDCTDKLGNVMTIYTEETGSITVSPLVMDSSFTKVDFATYGIEGGTYSGHKRQVTRKLGPNGLDKVIFSDTLRFDGKTFPRFIIGGNKDNEWIGVVFGVCKENMISLYGSGLGNANANPEKILFTSEGADTSIVGADVKLTASFEYVDHNNSGGENDLKIGVWFNGISYEDTYYYFDDCTDKLGNAMTIYTENDGSLTVGQPVVDTSFTEENFETYGIEKGEYSGHKKTVTKRKNMGNLDQIVFSDQVRFSGETFPRFIIGGNKDNEWIGVTFGVYQPNELYMYGNGFKTDMIKFTSAEAGTEVVDASVKLTVSFEYIDHNGSGGNDDLKIGVWFNNIAYGNAYYYFNDCADKLGNAMTIYIEDEGSLTVAPPEEPEENKFTDVNFESFGIQEGIYEAVGNGKLSASGTATQITNLDKVLFSDIVTFSEETFPRFIIGGNEDNGFVGVVFGVYEENKISMYGAGLGSANGNPSKIQFSSEGAETEIIGTSVKLTASFEYVNYNQSGGRNDLKITVWFNDKQYGDAYYFVDCTDKIGNNMSVYVEGEGSLTVGQPAMPEPPILNGEFTEINFATYGIASQHIEAKESAITRYGKSEDQVSVSNLDKVIFKDKVSFLTPDTQFIFGGKIQWYGLSLRAFPDTVGELQLSVSGLKGGAVYTFTNEEAGVDLRSKNLSVMISCEYVDHDKGGVANDLKFAIWFNGKCYKEQYLYIDNCTDYLGNQTIVYAAKGSEMIVGELNLPDEPEKPVINENFKKLNFDSYNIRPGVYEETMKGRLAATGKSKQKNLNKVILSDVVTFSDEPGARFIIGGKEEWQGIAVSAIQKDKLWVYGAGFATEFLTFTSEEAGTALTGKSMKLTMSFEYVNHNNAGGKNDLKFAIWFNDKPYEDRYYYFDDVADKLGNVMSLFIEDKGKLTIGTEEELRQEQPVINKNFRKLNFDSFGFESGTYHCRKGDLAATGKQEGSNLDKVIFSDTIMFSDIPGGRINIGGKETAWQGLGLHVISKGQLQLNAHAGNPFNPLIFKSDVAGVDLTGKKINITMSFEYVDSDKDGAKDDIKFAIWFDGKAYQNRYYYLTNFAPEIGSCMGIYIPDDSVTVTIETKTQPIDYGEFGFTKNWKKELRLNKK